MHVRAVHPCRSALVISGPLRPSMPTAYGSAGVTRVRWSLPVCYRTGPLPRWSVLERNVLPQSFDRVIVLAHLRQPIRILSEGSRFDVCSYENLAAYPFNQTFDCVLCNFALLGEASTEAVVGAARKLLSPDRRLVIQTLHPALPVARASMRMDGGRVPGRDSAANSPGPHPGISERSEPGSHYLQRRDSVFTTFMSRCIRRPISLLRSYSIYTNETRPIHRHDERNQRGWCSGYGCHFDGWRCVR
jgi:hypothetical protein